MSTLKTRIAALPLVQHIIFAGLAFGLFRAANIYLDALYAASKFPVPYNVGQTAFSGEKIKAWYQVMANAGTLPIYWQTQLFDFVFILTMATMGLAVPLLIRRLFTVDSLPYKLTTWAATLIPLGALLDVIENLISFVMLAQPATFANWIALVYSSAASLKFLFIASGYIAVFTALIVWIGVLLWRALASVMTAKPVNA